MKREETAITSKFRFKMFAFVVLTTLLFHAANAGEGEEKQGLGFLAKFGYLPKAVNGAGYLRTPETVSSALKNFQKYAGLNESGIVDKATIAKMQSPRCGMSDNRALRRGKRYVHQGSKWKKRRITWKILGYSRRGLISHSQTRTTMHNALQKWSKIANIDFVETRSDDADIRIKFSPGNHAPCRFRFDGPGGTLAHAFYPHNNKGMSGDAHFDDDERYTLGTSDGTNLFWVALHEFGHSIGLDHSNIRGAVMYPWYQGYKGDDVSLTDDDIRGAQSLYGARENRKDRPATSKPRGTRPPKKKTPPPFCLDKVKATLQARDGRIFLFGRNQLVVLNKKMSVAGGPFPIQHVFRGLKKVDAAMTTYSGNFVFFSGDKYWVFKWYERLYGPEPITKYGLTADMRDLDAAFSDKRTMKEYFFKGSIFWRYDIRRKSIDAGYPKHMRRWHSIPKNLDGAFKWKNKAIYFFKGEKFYRVDTRRFTLVKGYPKRLHGYFLPCSIGNGNGKLNADGAVRGPGSDGNQAVPRLISFALISSTILIGNIIGFI